MRWHKNLYARVASFENLLVAARTALRGKRGRASGAAFFAALEHEVAALHRELREDRYRHGPYHYFQIHDPKTRTVAAADFRDRVVHHAIVRVLEPLFEGRLIEDTYACRMGRGNHAAMRRAAGFARRFAYSLECDVSRYFPSIDHEVLLALLRHIVESHADGEETEWVGEGLFDVRVRRRGLPIGNLTSQFLANLYLSSLDHFVKHELRLPGYVRYLDDFVLFDHERAQRQAYGRAVKAKLGELRLSMHPDKYRLRPTRLGVDFVGFVAFADGRIRVRRASVRRFERRYGRRRWEVERFGGDAEALTRSVQAWVAHARHAKSQDLRRAVLARLGDTSPSGACGRPRAWSRGRSKGRAVVSSAPALGLAGERRGGPASQAPTDPDLPREALPPAPDPIARGRSTEAPVLATNLWRSGRSAAW